MFSNNKKELLYLIHIGIITGDLINKYSELFKSHHILYNTDVNDFEYGLIDSGEHACYGGTVVAHGDADIACYYDTIAMCFDNIMVIAYDQSYVYYDGNGYCECRDNARAIVDKCSYLVMCDKSFAHVKNDVFVELYNEASVLPMK